MEEPATTSARCHTCRALRDSSPQAAESGPIHEEVDTPEALLSALQEGVEHVVVVKHMDLSSLPPVEFSTDGSIGDSAVLMAGSTKSIRVCILPLFLFAVQLLHENFVRVFKECGCPCLHASQPLQLYAKVQPCRTYLEKVSHGLALLGCTMLTWAGVLD